MKANKLRVMLGYRVLVCKVFSPGNKGFKTVTLKAPKGNVFTSQGINDGLAAVANQVELWFPNEEYRLVQTTAGYSFVWEAEKLGIKQEDKEVVNAGSNT